MIISAFQSVGKSTLADNDSNYIDFESSNFDKSNPEWYIDYCDQAIKLANSGKTVFVSSHKPVRDYLKEHYDNYYMIMFAPELKQQVLDRLEQRYKNTNLDKDKRALERATNSFDSISSEIKQDESRGLNVYYITDMNYNLKDIINKLNKPTNKKIKEEISDDDLDILNIADTFKVEYEDDSFIVYKPLQGEGLAHLSSGTPWLAGEYYYGAREGKKYIDEIDDNSRNFKDWKNKYVIVDKKNPSKKYLYTANDTYFKTYSGRWQTAAAWLEKYGTDGLINWFLSNNFKGLTTSIKKKIGYRDFQDKRVYAYPNENEIPYEARQKATTINTIKVKNGTSSIKDVGGFPNVKKLIIPEGVKRINRSACSGLKSLEKVVLPSTVTKIGDYAFWNCENLKSVYIPKSVNTIGIYAFGIPTWGNNNKYTKEIDRLLDADNPNRDVRYRYRYTVNYTEDIIYEKDDGLTIYCEASEKPSGWSDSWNCIGYIGDKVRTYKSIYLNYKVVWGASMPSTITEDINDDMLEVEPKKDINDFISINKNTFKSLVRKFGNEKRWYIAITDDYTYLSGGEDELEDEYNGLFTYEEAKNLFLEYSLINDYNLAVGANESNKEYYTEDVMLYCITEKDYEENDYWCEDVVVANRRFCQSEDDPNLNVSEDIEDKDLNIGKWNDDISQEILEEITKDDLETVEIPSDAIPYIEKVVGANSNKKQLIIDCIEDHYLTECWALGYMDAEFGSDYCTNIYYGKIDSDFSLNPMCKPFEGRYEKYNGVYDFPTAFELFKQLINDVKKDKNLVGKKQVIVNICGYTDKSTGNIKFDDDRPIHGKFILKDYTLK